jgi:hypothetical protein
MINYLTFNNIIAVCRLLLLKFRSKINLLLSLTSGRRRENKYYRLVINTVGLSAKNQIKGSLFQSFIHFRRYTQRIATARNTSSHSI